MVPQNLEIDTVDALREKLAALETEIQRLKHAQRNSEQRFVALADAAPAMIWMTGPEALPTYFNRAWLEFRGRALEQEVGEGWTEGVHSDDRALRRETFLKAFQARQPFRIQYRLRRADGEYALVEEAGAPRCSDSGEFAGYVGSVAEIPPRHRPMPAPDEQSVRLVFSLTERERQVLVLIAQGKSTKEAAANLGISYKTADSHRSRILEKLGVHETASMVRYAIRAGLIEP